jgi:protein-tyrosine kinase
MDELGGSGVKMTMMQNVPPRTVGSTGPGLDLSRAKTVTIDPAALREERIIGFDPTDRDGRPFTLLRSRVLDLWRGQGRKLIGITSASPSAGKSFIACNVAASLATLPETRVVLFDLDLRRGTVAQNFGIDAGEGLETYLTGKHADLSAIGRKVDGLSLTLFPCSPVRGHSADL